MCTYHLTKTPQQRRRNLASVSLQNPAVNDSLSISEDKEEYSTIFSLSAWLAAVVHVAARTSRSKAGSLSLQKHSYAGKTAEKVSDVIYINYITLECGITSTYRQVRQVE